MKLVVIEYNSGNVQSVLFALRRLGIDAELTSDHRKITSADKLIFPGVGEASSTMRYLRSKGLDKVIPQLKQPLLGICLGLQLLCKKSEENNAICMEVFSEDVKRFAPVNRSDYKIPHMGWNSVDSLKGDLFKNIPENSQFYFVHSYFASLGKDTSAICRYANDFSAAMQRDNFYAVQFHPEKSANTGAELLRNFINL